MGLSKLVGSGVREASQQKRFELRLPCKVYDLFVVRTEYAAAGGASSIATIDNKRGMATIGRSRCMKSMKMKMQQLWFVVAPSKNFHNSVSYLATMVISFAKPCFATASLNAGTSLA